MPTGTDITVVTASVEDAETVGELLHSLLDELSNGRGPAADTLAETATALLGSGAIVGLIAKSGTEPVGVLCLNECASIYAGGHFGEITELYVSPEHRSHGVAPILLRAAKDVGARRGWSRLEVGAPDQPRWERTLQFYLREGFAEVGPRLKIAL